MQQHQGQPRDLETKCQVKKGRKGTGRLCAAPSGVIYLGKGICDQHWDALAGDPAILRRRLRIKEEA
jgi:hypothetical protein